jgi:DNA polymerase-1
VTKEQRDKAKALNFGIIYGMGSKAFSLSANISRDEAKAFIEEYFKIYSGLKSFMENLKNKARERGYSETLSGRKRFLQFIGSVGMQAAMEERIAINMPVQGLASDIIKQAMIKIDKHLTDSNLQDQIKMILQIHDELVFEVDKKVTQSKIFDTIKSMMEKNE